jgi:hypothetical protein
MKRMVISGRCFAGVKMAHPDGFSISSTGSNNYVFFPPLRYLVSAGFVEASGNCYPYPLIGRVFCRPGIGR